MKTISMMFFAVCACISCCAAEMKFTEADAHEAFEDLRTLVNGYSPRDATTKRCREAADWIAGRLKECGLEPKLDRFSAKTPRGIGLMQNVVVDIRNANTNSSWIVLLSHYDTAPTAKVPEGKRFQGANDGASTTALLIALARILKQGGYSKCNVECVWTDSEEAQVEYGENDGFQGSKRARDMALLSGKKIKAVICLDMLGDRDLRISIPANSSRRLAWLAKTAAVKIGEPDLVKESKYAVLDDFSAFLDTGFSAIDLIDFSYGPNNSWWHTAEDTVDKLSERSLLSAGRLVLAMLETID